MTIIQAVILGIVQGITEFFPISSSGHLIAIRYLFNFDSVMSSKEWFSFDIALHFGTLMAIAIFFFWDFIAMFRDGFKFKKNGKYSFANLPTTGKLLWYVILACIPAGIVGVLFDDVIAQYVREPWVIAITMSIMGIVLWFADSKSKAESKLENITLKQALLIGVGQMFAIIPGFSRSGTTMSVARMTKLDKESSAKFSFLLGAPIMLGAAVLGLKDLTAEMITAPFIIGVLVSFVVGLVAIKVLINIVKKSGFGVFAIYRFILSIILIMTMIVRGGM